MANERARRIVELADDIDRGQSDLDHLADRLWRTLVPDHPSGSLFGEGIAPQAVANWRRVAAEAARWAAEYEGGIE